MLNITNDVKDFMDKDQAIVYFTAEWCQPCKQLKPQFAKSSVIDHEHEYYLVDVDKMDPDALKKYDLRSIPQVFIMDQGEIVKTIKGRTSQEILMEISEK